MYMRTLMLMSMCIYTHKADADILRSFAIQTGVATISPQAGVPVVWVESGFCAMPQPCTPIHYTNTVALPQTLNPSKP